LEYHYINDPVHGKTANLTMRESTHDVDTPIMGGLYSYHVFPMIVIFILVGLGLSLIVLALTYLKDMKGEELYL